MALSSKYLYQISTDLFVFPSLKNECQNQDFTLIDVILVENNNTFTDNLI